MCQTPPDNRAENQPRNRLKNNRDQTKLSFTNTKCNTEEYNHVRVQETQLFHSHLLPFLVSGRVYCHIGG